MRQADVFRQSEGRMWLERNKDKLPVKSDPVTEAISDLGLKPRNILEVGCANGWRLLELHNRLGSHCEGVDPSIGKFQKIETSTFIRPGTAEALPFERDSFDLIIYGWCLYLCDPIDYFKIAAEGDRTLRDGGQLIIHDFYDGLPYKVPYRHKEGLFSHHFDFTKLWTGSPAYLVRDMRKPTTETCVAVLQKNLKDAFEVAHET